MGETVVCPEFPLLVSRAMIRICRAEFSRAMVVPILAVAFCGVALGCQSIDLSEPTDGGEGNKYEAPTAAPAVPFQQLKLAGSTRGGGCMRVRPALPPRLKQGRSTGSFRRMQLHPRRGSVEPFALCGPTPKRCWQLAAGTSQAHSQVLYRAGRRFGCPFIPFPGPVPRSALSRAVTVSECREARGSKIGGYRRLEQLYRIACSSGPEHAGWRHSIFKEHRTRRLTQLETQG